MLRIHLEAGVADEGPCWCCCCCCCCSEQLAHRPRLVVEFFFCLKNQVVTFKSKQRSSNRGLAPRGRRLRWHWCGGGRSPTGPEHALSLWACSLRIFQECRGSPRIPSDSSGLLRIPQYATRSRMKDSSGPHRILQDSPGSPRIPQDPLGPP